jgi:hypothetical protein
MPKYTITYAIYYELEVMGDDEEDAYEIGKEQIPSMVIKPDDWLLAGSEEVEEEDA